MVAETAETSYLDPQVGDRQRKHWEQFFEISKTVLYVIYPSTRLHMLIFPQQFH